MRITQREHECCREEVARRDFDKLRAPSGGNSRSGNSRQEPRQQHFCLHQSDKKIALLSRSSIVDEPVLLDNSLVHPADHVEEHPYEA